MTIPISMLARVALALAALAGPALAEDGKTLPGSACQPFEDFRLRQLYRGGGLIYNLGNTTEAVVCPVVKDLNKIKRAVVMVIDGNPDPDPDDDIVCSLKTLGGDGAVKTTRSQKSSGFSDVAKPLNFSAQSAAANGSYYLYCTLPPYYLPNFRGSAIASYTVVED